MIPADGLGAGITLGWLAAILLSVPPSVWLLFRIAKRIAAAPALPSVFVGVLVLYYPTLFGGPFSDDWVYVFGNSTLQNSSLVSVITGPTNDYEHLPLRDLSYWIDWRIFGTNPVPYKLHNLGWYLLGCLSAGFASRQLALLFSCSQQTADTVAFATLLLFTFHPLHVESVAWISGRKELISGALTLLATGLFAKGLLTDRDSYLWGSVLAFAGAMAGKSTGILFPLVALALAWPKLATQPKRLAPVAAMFGIAAFAYFYAKGIGTTHSVSSDMWGWGDYPGFSPGFSLEILGLAFWKSIAPFDLRLIYDDLFPTPSLPYLTLGSAVVASGAIALWRFGRTRPLEVFCVVWFAAFTVPFLQLVPFRTWSPFSDRFAYLSVFAIALGIASLLTRRATRARQAAAISIVLSFITLTAIRAYDWRSHEALIRQTAERSPNSSIAQSLLVERVLLPAGQYEEAAVAAAALEAKKRDPLLAQIGYARLGAKAPPDERRHFLRSAYASRPEAFAAFSTMSLMWYSSTLSANGLFAESEQILRIMLARLDVSQAHIRFRLGQALKGQDRAAEARREFELAAAGAGRDDELRSAAMQAAADLAARAP